MTRTGFGPGGKAAIVCLAMFLMPVPGKAQFPGAMGGLGPGPLPGVPTPGLEPFLWRYGPSPAGWNWPNVSWPSPTWHFTYWDETKKNTYRVFYPGGLGGSYTITTPALSEPPSDRSARLDVTVPTNEARVWLEGVRTDQQGMVRTFRSPPLAAGRRYAYEIRASWLENGALVSQTREVAVLAGSRTSMAFTVSHRDRETAVSHADAPSWR